MNKYLQFCLLTIGLLGSTCVRADEDRGQGSSRNAVYTMDNGSGRNSVLVFDRGNDGSLTSADTVATGGLGTGAGLGSQGSVLLSHDGRWLFVCDAGSDEISVFAVTDNGLTLTDKESSAGRRPVSLTLNRNLLYVLNAGGAVGDKDTITGFVFAFGKLVHLPGSTQPLSAASTKPAQVGFADDGDILVVTETGTSVIDTYQLGDYGVPVSHHAFQSLTPTPFGFAVGSRNRLFVSEAAGGAVNGSSVSSYESSEEGLLQALDQSVPTEQTAACWAVLSHDGRFVYVANAGSGSISGFDVSANGGLSLLTPGGRTGVTGTGSHPTDMVISRNGQFLYSLNNGNGTISAFQVNNDGSLYALTGATGLPTSSNGLAGR